MFAKDRAKIETVNDIDGNVTNFFEILRDKPSELIQSLRLTPWSRDEAMKPVTSARNKIDKARLFWVQCWMTIAQTDKNKSFRVSKDTRAQPANIMLEIDYLFEVAKRLQGVQIENKNAIEFIASYAAENALIYFDPPYLSETRSHKNEYAFETDKAFHVQAFEMLNDVKGYKIVSGYASELYSQMYEQAGWRRIDFELLANSGQVKTESLWLSKNLPDKACARQGQVAPQFANFE